MLKLTQIALALSLILVGLLPATANSQTSGFRLAQRPSKLSEKLIEQDGVIPADPIYVPSSTSQPEPQPPTPRVYKLVCPENESVGVRLLAPEDHVTQTISERPTFFFDIYGSAEYRAVLSISEGNQVLVTIEIPTVEERFSRYVEVTLPPEAPPLEDGKEYILSFGRICNPQQPSLVIYGTVPFRKVSLPELTQLQLQQASPTEQVKILGQNGIWYDALALAFQTEFELFRLLLGYINPIKISW